MEIGGNFFNSLPDDQAAQDDIVVGGKMFDGLTISTEKPNQNHIETKKITRRKPKSTLAALILRMIQLYKQQ